MASVPGADAEVCRRAVDEIWGEGDLDLADELYTSDALSHDPNQTEVRPGPAGVRALVHTWRAIFPDLAMHVDTVVEGAGHVMLRWSAAGTHEGDQLGVPPTHRRVHVTGLLLCRMEQGRIAETWAEWDAAGMLRQIGATLVPVPHAMG